MRKHPLFETHEVMRLAGHGKRMPGQVYTEPASMQWRSPKQRITNNYGDNPLLEEFDDVDYDRIVSAAQEVLAKKETLTARDYPMVVSAIQDLLNLVEFMNGVIEELDGEAFIKSDETVVEDVTYPTDEVAEVYFLYRADYAHDTAVVLTADELGITGEEVEAAVAEHSPFTKTFKDYLKK